MTDEQFDLRIISDWVRIGVLINYAPSDRTPDVEHLLLDTARVAHADPLAFTMAATWLVEYGRLVAVHRLKRLIVTELEHDYVPVLGYLLQTAVDHGATPKLSRAIDACEPATTPEPLFDAYKANPTLVAISEQHATEESKRWGLWAPPVQLKFDALRPTRWILRQNPEFRERAIRNGDLRCSILETLRRDVKDHRVASESELARLCAANRAAVRKALDDLELEGYELRAERSTDHEQPIVLPDAA